MEAKAAHDAADMILAQEAGTVVEVDGVGITVEYKKPQKGMTLQQLDMNC